MAVTLTFGGRAGFGGARECRRSLCLIKQKLINVWFLLASFFQQHIAELIYSEWEWEWWSCRRREKKNSLYGCSLEEVDTAKPYILSNSKVRNTRRAEWFNQFKMNLRTDIKSCGKHRKVRERYWLEFTWEIQTWKQRWHTALIIAEISHLVSVWWMWCKTGFSYILTFKVYTLKIIYKLNQTAGSS